MRSFERILAVGVIVRIAHKAQLVFVDHGLDSGGVHERSTMADKSSSGV